MDSSVNHSRALEDEVSHLAALLEAAQTERQRFETKWNEARMRTEDAEDKIYSLDAQNQALHEQITQLQQDQANYFALQEEFDSVKTTNADLMNELDELQAENDRLNNEFDELQQDVLLPEEDLQAQAMPTPRANKELEDLVVRLRDRISTLEENQDQYEQLMQQERWQQKEHIEELEMSLTVAQEEARQWEEQAVFQNVSQMPDTDEMVNNSFDVFVTPELRQRRRKKKHNSVQFPLTPKNRKLTLDSDEKTILIDEDLVNFSPVGSMRSIKTVDSLSTENLLMMTQEGLFVESCRGSVIYQDSRRASIELDLSRRIGDIVAEAKSCVATVRGMLRAGKSVDADLSTFSNLLDEFNDAEDQGAALSACARLEQLLEEMSEKNIVREREVASDISELSALAEDKQCKIKLLCKDIYDREEAHKELDSFSLIFRDCLDRTIQRVTSVVVPL